MKRGEHLVLVGLPGAGKTTVGRSVARGLGLPFVDLDAEIEEREGATVAGIFATAGEARFRQLERELTEELVTRPGSIVAAGGGWAAAPGLVALLRPPGRRRHLRVTPETAEARMAADVVLRPLLRDDPLSTLRRLATERATSFAEADAEVDTENKAAQEVAEAVQALAAQWGVS